MADIRLLALFSVLAMTVVTMGDGGKCIGQSKCKDGRNGRDGQDGRDGLNGRDGKDICFENLGKPSIHLDGTQMKSIYFPANKNIDIWSTTGPNGHISGGMMYANGVVTVPVSGLYYVYCQLYYTAGTKMARHGMYVNNHRLIALAHGSHNPMTGTCYTGVSIKLNKGDHLSCRILISNTHIWSGTAHTFFGAFLN